MNTHQAKIIVLPADNESAGEPAEPGSSSAQRESASAHGKSIIQSIRGWLRDSFYEPRESVREALEEAVEGVLEEHADDGAAGIDPEERQMIQNLLEFGELEVEDVMIHRAQVDAISENLDLKALLAKVLEMGHSRLPVYRGSLDEVIGLIHIKDMIRFIGNESAFDMKAMLRPVFAVPASMKVVDLLVKMRATRCHMAIVVDEFGGTDGIVTLEDLFEAIVGDIRDEHDDGDDNRRIQAVGTDELIVDARVEIEELENKLGFSICDDDEDEREFDTIGGLVFSLLGHVPRRNETVQHKRLFISVESADARRIHRLRIKILPLPKSDEEE